MVRGAAVESERTAVRHVAWAAIILLLAATVLTAPFAMAQPDGDGDGADTTGTSAETGGGADSEVVLIMDASSSMMVTDDGETRLDAAKRASVDLVDSLPATAQVGLVAYGTTVDDAPENHAAGCEDIRTIAPVQQVDKDLLRDEIEGMEARGYTPIGESLLAAADEFSDDAAERSIVLVSDGLETCAPPPPCEIAEELADQGIDLTIHTVGFHVDDAARADLECIAGATGGSYRAADDAEALTESMRFLTQRAIVGYETFGTEIDLSETRDDALYLGEGLYRTSMDHGTSDVASVSDAPERFFRLAVPDNHRAWVSMTPIPVIEPDDSGGGEDLIARLSAENDSHYSCWSNSDLAITTGGGFEPPDSAVIELRQNRSADGPTCVGEEWVVNAQAATRADEAYEDLDVELSVQFEPMYDDAETGAWPEGDAGGDSPDPVEADGEPLPVEGGNSMNNATELTEGTFSDAIVPGEFRYYKLPVQWGERPVITARTGPSVNRTSDIIYAKLNGPARHQLDNNWTSFFDSEAETTVSASSPVEHRNREINRGGLFRSFAGDHYVAVSMNLSGDGLRGIEQPFELGVRMEGDPGAGPEWQPIHEPGPEPSATPPGTGDAAPADPEADADADEVAMGEEQTSMTLVWAALAVGVLVVVGIIMVLRAVSRRRGAGA